MKARFALTIGLQPGTILAVVLFALLASLITPASSLAAAPTVIDPATGQSTWTYDDLYDLSPKYEGGYAVFDSSVEATWYANPHGGYDTATNKCKVCHAVHRAEGAYYLLRADSQDDACDYCHIGGSAHSSKVVYDLNSAGKATPNGHTIGASTFIPDSSIAQWTEEVILGTVDAGGNPVLETINVRAYDEQKNDMYRFARHHGHSEATGSARRNYVPVGPLALRCMSCHQVHNADAMTWQTISMSAMDNTGDYTGAAVSGYKLLKQFPSGTFVGTTDTYGQIPLGNLSLVPETTLTVGVNFDAARAQGADPTALNLVRGTSSTEYNKPMWVAQNIDHEGDAGRDERSNPAAVNNASLSVWCADCHNLNIGGWKLLGTPELGYKAHTERTHPSPYIGAFNGPGQCYSCHRSDLPRKNTGDPCSQCHYGTGNYRENRYDQAGFEYVDSDFPHSGEDGDFKMLGSYSVDVAGLNPTTIDETVTVGPDNLDAVCLRCHWVAQSYHDGGGSSAFGHDIPAEYTVCTVCHPGADVTDIHAAPGCEACHDAGTLTNDCATCHPEKLTAHGYETAQHTATPPNAAVLIFARGDHEPGVMTWDGEVVVACNTCHNMELGPIHGNACTTCHPSPFDTLSSAWSGGCQQGGCHTTYHADSNTAHLAVDDQCNSCHDASWNVTAASCPNCHATYNPADTTPPVTTSNALAAYTGAAFIDFSITDGGKVGVGTTYFKVDGGATQSGSSVTVSSAGAHALEFWSVDQAGNVENPHKFAIFTLTADTTPPVTTSNAGTTYYQTANITLSATDASTAGVKATHWTLNGGPTQTGTSIVIGATSGTVAYTLVFWSEDYSGNVETQHTANFTLTGGTGTIRLVWGDSDITGPPGPDSAAAWTVRRGSWSGPIVATGSGAYPGWSGVDNVTVPVLGQPYFILVDWWDESEGYWDQSAFGNIYISTAGQVVRLSY